MAAEEKTEPATAKKRREQRKEGNIFQSKEITTVALVAIMFYSLKFLMPFLLQTASEAIHYFWSLLYEWETIGDQDVIRLGIEGAAFWAKSALPLLLICALVSVVATMMQTQMLVTFKALRPKVSKLNPLKVLQNMVSLRSMVELVKSILKIIVLGYLVWRNFIKHLEKAPRLMDMDIMGTVDFIGDMVMTTVLQACVFFAFLAVGDYIYQKFSYEKQIRMSKQEVKEEYKNTEGDPQIKGKIRQKQREMAQHRMMADVPSADVVIRNPTHFAVALRFDLDKDNAPQVIAKGADLLALRIVRIAEENDVPIMENKPLARGLYDAVDIGREIPEQFYGPVAEVLAFVYKLKNKKLDGRLL